MKTITILGATGSIGTQALEIVKENPNKYKIDALTCHSRVGKLMEEIDWFHPKAVSVGTKEDADRVSLFAAAKGLNLQVFYGEEGLYRVASCGSDIVLNAIVGIAGLMPTYKAIEEGSYVALANKETIVTGGRIILDFAKKKGVKILPVDSEHSAIFQCLEGNRDRKISRILLTSSGGPFRGKTAEFLKSVKPKDALKHPSWSMGSKITIDSATMMNKGLEVIEARYLFNVEPEKIQIVVHPECALHSAVEFEDGAVIGQMARADMKLPIGFALAYPNRLKDATEPFDIFGKGACLHFEKPDRNVFKCINLAYRALSEGESSLVVLNAANEVLVGKFLKGEIGFTDIQDGIERALDNHKSRKLSTIEEILELD